MRVHMHIYIWMDGWVSAYPHGWMPPAGHAGIGGLSSIPEVVGWLFYLVVLLLPIFSRWLKERDPGTVMYKLLGFVRSSLM